MTDDEIAANRDKRPLYKIGQRLTMATPGIPVLDGGQCIVRSIRAVQTRLGLVMTYQYRLELDNLAIVALDEELLTPTEGAWEPPPIPLPEELLKTRSGKPLPGRPNPITKTGFGRGNREDGQP